MTLEKLISLICEELGLDEDSIDEETAFGELVSDELELEELAGAIENEFEVDLGGAVNGDITAGELAEIIEDGMNS